MHYEAGMRAETFKAIEAAVRRLRVNRGALVRMVRETAHDSTIRTMADLNDEQGEALLHWLDEIERGEVCVKFRLEGELIGA